MTETGVCVIIAAYRASATIARAVASALAQPEVVEILVVDDASPDDTADAARACDDGSGRLTVMRMAENGGPSRARNAAIAASTASLIAVLDADDMFLPGRFAALCSASDWDFIADNVAMISEDDVDRVDLGSIARHRITPVLLTASQFAQASISQANRYRGELAFLKPLMRRDFLDRHSLRYAENMRLAEDYDLYLRALMAGARFRIAASCHYVAVERWGSLSHHHRVADLVRFEAAIARLQAAAGSDLTLYDILGRHRRQTARKRHHRTLLERKKEVGLIRAVAEQTRSPIGLASAIADVAQDKLHDIYAKFSKTSTPAPRHDIRFLIDAV